MEALSAIRVSAAQFQGSADRQRNWDKIGHFVVKAAGEGYDLVLFHEMATTDFFCSVYGDFPDNRWETIPGESVLFLCGLARRNRIWIAAGLAEYSESDGKRYNSAVMINDCGELIGSYRKLHRDGAEEHWFAPGDLQPPVFPGPKGIRCGIMICYDRHFPEVARRLARHGAGLVLLLATTAVESWTLPLWVSELRAIASLNRMYLVAANRVGKDLNTDSSLIYFGRSLIVDPSGKVMAEASGEREELIGCEIRLDKLEPAGSPTGQDQAAGGKKPENDEESEGDGMALPIEGGFSRTGIGFLPGGMAREVEAWRLLALHGCGLVIVTTERSDDLWMDEMRYLALTGPFHVLVTGSGLGSILIRPNGTVLRCVLSTVLDPELLAAEREAQALRTGVVRHRRPDLIRKLLSRMDGKSPGS